SCVPNGEGEHAAQVLHAFLSILLVQVDDSLGVAVRAIRMATSHEFFPQLSMVVDFAIENNPQRFNFVADGLMTGGEINNTEPAHADADAAVNMDAIVVWTAMRYNFKHAVQDGRIGTGAVAKLVHSRYSTHDATPLLSG